MDTSKDTRDREITRRERELEDEGERAPGDILGVSRIPAGGGGGDTLPAREDEEEDAHQPPLPEERSHVGSRDVTDGTTGGTGPDTGGTGVFRRGSGATGTDIGR